MHTLSSFPTPSHNSSNINLHLFFFYIATTRSCRTRLWANSVSLFGTTWTHASLLPSCMPAGNVCRTESNIESLNPWKLLTPGCVDRAAWILHAGDGEGWPFQTPCWMPSPTLEQGYCLGFSLFVVTAPNLSVMVKSTVRARSLKAYPESLLPKPLYIQWLWIKSGQSSHPANRLASRASS